MFGAFRCNKDAWNNLEFVDLSRNSTVDARNYTVQACNQCRERKLKCSGEPNGCRRCREASIICTYRSAAKSTDSTGLKRRRPATGFEQSPRLSNKKQQNKKIRDGGDEVVEAESTELNQDQSLPVEDLSFTEQLNEWDQLLSKEYPSLDMSPGDMALPPLPFPLHDASPFCTTPVNSADPNQAFLLTPPSTAHTAINTSNTSVTHSSPCPRNQSTFCNCIKVLADVFERINGEGHRSATDGTDRSGEYFDDRMVHLRDGIETCLQVVPCKLCSVCTTNAVMLSTIVQQLAILARDLREQLLQCRRDSKSLTAGKDRRTPALPLSSGVMVGRYQVRVTELHLEFFACIMHMHLNDLEKLLGSIKSKVRKGSKAAKMIDDAARIARKASDD